MTRRALLPLLLATTLAAGCRDAESGPAGAGSGTERMIARLDSIDDPVLHSARAAEMERMTPPADLRGTLTWRAGLAEQLLRAGRTEDATARLREILDIAADYEGQVPPQFLWSVRSMLGTAHLWRGIQRNCIRGESVRCFVPVPPEGVFPDAEGPRAAIREYLTLLEEAPGDLLARWLLNLAYMTAGLYPDSVPDRWLFPPSVFRSEHEIGRFPEVAERLGLDALSLAGGSVLEDLSGNGHLDIMVSGQALSDQIRYFQNNGDGTFTERTREAGLEGLTGGLNMQHADYDNDGNVDVLVLRGGWAREGQPNSLLRNLGPGPDGIPRFADVTEEAGVLSSHPTQTAAWGDFDNDGWLDLFIGNEYRPGELYLSNGDGTFREVAAEAGLAGRGFVKAAVAGDYDNDGLLDLYLSRFGEWNSLYRNEGPGPDGIPRFTDVTQEAGVAQPMESFPAWFWDYDNDGHLDLFVSGYRLQPANVPTEFVGRPLAGALPRLYRNKGDGTFEDVTAETRLERVLTTMGSNFGDLDNDGWLDFYAGTGEPDYRALFPNRMFRNDGGRRFQDVTTSGGFGHYLKGHGVSFGDIDGDGDQDIHVQTGGATEADLGRNILFENPGHGNAWVTLQLEGSRSNRSAIGARVRVSVETEDGGSREIHRVVGTGGSFGSNSLQKEIGLGRAARIREVEVWWPASGRRDVYGDVPLRRVWRIREGAASLEPVEATRVRLGGGRPEQQP